MSTLRTWALVAAACGLVAVGAAAEDPKAPGGADKDKKVEKKEKPKAELPRMRYEHTTQAGRKGNFTLDREGGTADYYFNGAHRTDKLVFVRPATMPDAGSPRGFEGWVYQVERDGKKVPLWFFFGSTAVKNRQGETVYPMYYSAQPPQGSDGKQPWTRIYTDLGTKATKLDAK
jgi:hypothetical protein